MRTFKKWIGCIISFLSGFLGLILSLCYGMKLNATVDASALQEPYASQLGNSIVENVEGHKVITDSGLLTKAQDLSITAEFSWLRAFAIITMVVSILLLVYSIILLLKNVNVIKSEHKAFDIINCSLITLLLVAVVGLFITSCNYVSAIETATLAQLKETYTALAGSYVSALKFNVVATIGSYQPIMLAVGIVAFIANSIFTYLNHKNV